MRNGGRGHRVLENQVPSDDPGKKFTKRRIGVGVGRPRHGYHRRKLRIAHSRENTRDPGHDEREHERGTGAIVRRNARQHENSGADDRSDPKRRELHRPEHAVQPIFSAKFFEQNFV